MLASWQGSFLFPVLMTTQIESELLVVVAVVA